jgi:hypothetical protein
MLKDDEGLKWEEMVEKVEELAKLISEMEDEKADAALYACFQIVTQAADSHIEGVGILSEAMLEWREASLEAAAAEDCDGLCDDCKKKKEEDNKDE